MNKELEIITEYIEKVEEYEKKTGKQYPSIYMSKEVCIAIKEKLQRLEAIDNSNLSEDLKTIDEIKTKHTKYHTTGIASGTIEMDQDYFFSLMRIAESNIKKLKQIEEAKKISPNEQALDCLRTLQVMHHLHAPVFPKSYEYCNIIKDALTYKSKKELAFDLIDTKNVDIKLLKWAYPSVEAYNVKVRTEKDYWWREELTKEEFEFLSKMVNAE